MSETTLTKLDLRVGILKDVTEYTAQGYYTSCDKIRFRDGKPEKINGWVKEIAPQYTDPSIQGFSGVARDIHSWIGLDGDKFLAVGTHNRLQLFTGGQVYDITPIQTSTSVSNVLQTVSGNPLVGVSASSHGRQIGDLVEVLNQTTSVGNVKLDGVYEVVSVASPDFYYVSVPLTPSITTVATGGGVQINYLLPSGARDNGFLFGWGAGTWGTPGASVSAGWGNPRGSGTPQTLRQWSLDNWGEYLVANPRGERIYKWIPPVGPAPIERATLISASPSVVNSMMIAQPARHMMAFGCTNFAGVFDPLMVRWSDSENFDDWTPSVSSEAGEFRLKGGNFIVGAEQTSKEIVAVTDSASHKIKYLANDYVFGSDQVGSDGGLVSQQAIVDVNGIVFWMGYSSFFTYDQKVRKLPCSLDKSIFDPDRNTSLNFGQKEKVFGAHNTQYSEVMWFYPSKNSLEIDRYVKYNYLENAWDYGTLDRTVWEDISIFDRPYAVNADGTLYVHESGNDADGSPMLSFIESGEIDISDGNQLMFVDKLIPDFTMPDNKPLEVVVSYKKYPGDMFQTKTFTITNQTNFVNMRIKGRRLKVKYTSEALGGDFEVGTPEFGVKPDGAR
jgi:hypothetical protein